MIFPSRTFPTRTFTRRHFLNTTAAAGTITVLPFRARAQEQADSFETSEGNVVVHPIHHASLVLETPKGTIYADPVGDPVLYNDFPRADLILVSHEHGDHFNADTLSALMTDKTRLITNPAVYDKLPEALKKQASALANGDETEIDGLTIEAIPAYNMTPDRLKFHPKGRDNGYVLSLDDFRIYISGDTEDIPEMRALEDIDIAFVCMNLPFTMDSDAAASAVAEFAPKVVYPYHYRGKDGGSQDPEAFAAKFDVGITVRQVDWYK